MLLALVHLLCVKSGAQNVKNASCCATTNEIVCIHAHLNNKSGGTSRRDCSCVSKMFHYKGSALCTHGAGSGHGRLDHAR